MPLDVFGTIEVINGYIWGPWTFFVLLACGIVFTLWTRFCQFGAMTHGVQVIRGVYDSPNDPGAINHFQALSAALSATVGLGNIGGVALAVAAGGPGAVFWMWVIGFLGMAIKTIEVTLAMIYRDIDEHGEPHGGAMWVLEKTIVKTGGPIGWLGKFLAIVFCITCVISTMTGGNMFQCWSVADLCENYFGVPRVGTGILLVALVGMVIIGGIKRIGHVAGALVPFMCLVYLLSGLSVLAMHVAEIPQLLWSIVASAFAPTEAAGAFLGGTMGATFTIGMQRALFSNEAGQGSAPMAHAAAKSDEPAREGIVAGLEPFIDTICVCTLSALVILVTGTYNRDSLGPLEGSLSVALDASASSSANSVFTVTGPTNVDALPTQPLGRVWADQNGFFVIAQTDGEGRHRETGTNRIRIEGKVLAFDTSDGKRSGELRLEWSPITLRASDWTVLPTAISIPDSGVYQNLDGASMTALAFDREFPGLGKWLVTFVAWLFAVSTVISWSYYGEQAVIYMFGTRSIFVYKVFFLFMSLVSTVAISNADEMILLMDLGTGAMLVANLPVMILMGHRAVAALALYYQRLRAGQFKPHAAPPLVDVVEGTDVEQDYQLPK